MITLRWSLFMEQEIPVDYYNVFRSMIGFVFPISAIGSGATLNIKANGGANQLLTLPALNSVDYLNSVLVNAYASESFDGLSVYIRSTVGCYPGSIEILENTLGLTPRLITERSESELIGIVTADNTDGAVETFIDNNGNYQDFYAVSSVGMNAIESKKTSWRQPLPAQGPLCVVEGTVINLQGIAIADIDVVATLHETPKARSLSYITREPISTKTSPEGRFSLPLVQGALVKLEIPAVGYSQMVTIPCRSYIFLQELLVDMNYTYPLGYRE